jgi:uncharacterized Zn finger protein
MAHKDTSSVTDGIALYECLTEPDEEPEAGAMFPPEPLPSDAESFWRYAKTSGTDYSGVSIPHIPAVQVGKLGSFPLWRGQDNFLEFLEKVYSKASHVGLEIFLGESGADTAIK